MTTYLKRLNKNKGGFTLVEVIVVLVILAILAAIAVPAMTGWIDNAKQNRTIVACRTCVTAAQTLVSEEYGKSGTTATPSATDVLSLAKIDGTVSGIQVDSDDQLIDMLTYKDTDNNRVTYMRLPSPHYQYGGFDGWASDTVYHSGDIVQSGDLILKCVVNEGQNSTGKEPGTTGGRSHWRVIETVSGEPPEIQSSIYRYDAGFIVKSGNYLYQRTSYDLPGGQTPSATSLYWTQLGPVTP